LEALADTIDRIATDMANYEYPPEAESRILLDQQNYTAGGLSRKEETSENSVQAVLKTIGKIKALLPKLRENVGQVQESCYSADLYGKLYDASKAESQEFKLTSICQRKDDQRKLRGKRERQLKARSKKRIATLDNVITQSSRRRQRRRSM